MTTGFLNVGSESIVNTNTVGVQTDPTSTGLVGGGYVVSWVSSDESGPGIFAQLYDENGNQVGSEFQVNTFAYLVQNSPDIIALDNGGFVVAWSSQSQGGSTIAQIYDASGQPVGNELTLTAGVGLNPSLAPLPGGGFVAAFEAYGDNSGIRSGVYAQVFDDTGAPVGPEFLVNTYVINDQFQVDVAASSNGNFLVTWTSIGQTGGSYGAYNADVYGQLYAADGTPIGGEFRVNTYSEAFPRNSQENQSVMALENGDFVVVWESSAQENHTGMGLYGQRYTSSGIPFAGEFRIFDFPSEIQGRGDIEIASLADGGFVVVWFREFQVNNSVGRDIVAKRFDANGDAIGSEYIVNSYVTGTQHKPTIASLSDGGFAISWESVSQTGNASKDIYTQVFDAQTFGTHGIDNLVDTIGAGWMHGQGGDDVLYGLTGNDLIHGGAGDDTLYGGEGSDRLKGNTGNDTLYGGAGNDFLKGQAGDDILIGGVGMDALRGGAGADTFVFNAVEDSTLTLNDRIMDFEQGIDVIDFSNIGGLTFIGSEDFSGTGGEIRAYERNGNTILRIDVDGDGVADMKVFIYGAFAITDTDFLL